VRPLPGKPSGQFPLPRWSRHHWSLYTQLQRTVRGISEDVCNVNNISLLCRSTCLSTSCYSLPHDTRSLITRSDSTVTETIISARLVSHDETQTDIYIFFVACSLALVDRYRVTDAPRYLYAVSTPFSRHSRLSTVCKKRCKPSNVFFSKLM